MLTSISRSKGEVVLDHRWLVAQIAQIYAASGITLLRDPVP